MSTHARGNTPGQELAQCYSVNRACFSRPKCPVWALGLGVPPREAVRIPQPLPPACCKRRLAKGVWNKIMKSTFSNTNQVASRALPTCTGRAGQHTERRGPETLACQYHLTSHAANPQSTKRSLVPSDRPADCRISAASCGVLPHRLLRTLRDEPYAHE